ncbi:unnamed protein product [Chrysodeixis includens]|uniref:Uncharacterized protein n=1 Tax=Chrysodeixis includens TaxID=689277 RepID=A0A9N8KWX5_CHRIL|nr:unnamed protein product [Chrysodeixis includens]
MRTAFGVKCPLDNLSLGSLWWLPKRQFWLPKRHKYNEYKKKKRENYHAKKRLTKDLNPKERYNARVIWRIRKKNQRERVRNLNRVLEETPPSSPGFPDADTDAEQDVADQNKNYDVHQEQNVCDSPTVGAAKKGRMKVRRDRSKIYRENVELKKENEKLKHKYEKYKKRLQRTKKKLEKKVLVCVGIEPTPREYKCTNPQDHHEHTSIESCRYSRKSTFYSLRARLRRRGGRAVRCAKRAARYTDIERCLERTRSDFARTINAWVKHGIWSDTGYADGDDVAALPQGGSVGQAGPRVRQRPQEPSVPDHSDRELLREPVPKTIIHYISFFLLCFV